MTKRSKAIKEKHGKKKKGGAEGKSKSKAESRRIAGGHMNTMIIVTRYKRHQHIPFLPN